jgi:hypothetical protein
LDDAFTSVDQWNLANPHPNVPLSKTIQLIVTPGLNSPKWVRDQLTSCDSLFDSTLGPPPASSCGMATFSASKESADSTVLPLPWDPTYQADWRTFLTALAARYGSNPDLVSIAVAGPTAASAEMILPNGDDADQWNNTISKNDMWSQLLELCFSTRPASFWSSDQAFIDAWEGAIDMYGTFSAG